MKKESLSHKLRRAQPKLSEGRTAQSGIALFMVIASMTVLSVLTTEFVYNAQVAQRMAFDGADQLKALYLAKTGLKLSLLRLKAYQNVKSLVNSNGGGGGAAGALIPKGLIEKIWNFPFFYPIPKDIPGLSIAQKDEIDKFSKESSLDGRFSAAIESEGAKFNLNMILAAFVPEDQPSTGPSANASKSPNDPPENGGPSPSASPSFNPETARKTLTDTFQTLLANKFEEDAEFADEYRNFRLEDLMENIFSWADRSYERKNLSGREEIPFKRAPFYSLNELHMVHLMDDQLFDLFAPALTVSVVPGVNVNAMKEPTFRALMAPRQLTKDEVKEFFEFRDDPEKDNTFKTPDDFFKYLQDKFYRGDEKEVGRYKEELKSRNLRVVTDEQVFKVVVQATANQATKLIEAWVTMTDGKNKPTKSSDQSQNQGQTDPTSPPADPAKEKDPGLKITFMRIL